MKGMGKTSVSNLAHAAHHDAMESMHGDIGSHHEEAARKYPEGSRPQQFHEAVSNSHYYASDSHYLKKKNIVSRKTTGVVSAMTRTSGDGTLPTYHGNLSGRYN